MFDFIIYDLLLEYSLTTYAPSSSRYPNPL